jgi:hypothetical protein
MPLVTIVNWPEQLVGNYVGEGVQPLELALALRQACVDAEVPDLTSVNMVTVVLGPRQLIRDDRVLIIEVTRLFALPTRTAEDLRRLAECLANVAQCHLHSTWGIEVFIQQYDPETQPFCALPATRTKFV